jgi:hypothetical protein
VAVLASLQTWHCIRNDGHNFMIQSLVLAVILPLFALLIAIHAFNL